MTPIHLAGYDGSAASRSAVVLAGRLAQAAGEDLVVAHVYPVLDPRGAPTIELEQSLRDAGAEVLAGLEVPGVARTILEPSGSPAMTLHGLAESEDASLLAVGVTHREGLGRVLPGSVPAKLLHGAPCPVLVVPAGAGERPIASVGVAYDGSPQAGRALTAARTLSARHDATLVVLAVHQTLASTNAALAAPVMVEIDTQDEYEAEIRARLAAAGTADVTLRVLEGWAPAMLEAAAEGLDVLVTGSRGYGPLRSVLVGSASHHLVDHAPCPVLVIPREDD
jgi:nucleotide-binding universal stress UspA family protein